MSTSQAPVTGDEPASVVVPEQPQQARHLPPSDEPEGPPILDDVCAAAVPLARSAAVETAGVVAVGEHLGVSAEPDGLAVHLFRCLNPGYRGWAWAVSLARPPQQEQPTVCEVVLLPQAEAVLAPQWLPWAQRLAPGDLGVGHELPYRADDPNLVPGYALSDTVTDPMTDALVDPQEADDRVELWRLGLGRVRVLGPDGAREAASRWRAGVGGPDSDVAVHAPAACVSCGYFVPLAGLLRQGFGVCANDWSPSDGRVVTVDHGCGAHSETDAAAPVLEPLPPVLLDESRIDEVDLSEPEPEPAPGSAEEPLQPQP